jgi:fatty acid desaturase
MSLISKGASSGKAVAMILFKIYLFYCGGGLVSLLYLIGVNTTYYINIYGDHDFYETKIENAYNGDDWLKRQICNSGNFLNDNMIWTRMFSGINYQIEHHLFPNVSSIHYPEISKIVKKYCLENNIGIKGCIYETIWYQFLINNNIILKKSNIDGKFIREFTSPKL